MSFSGFRCRTLVSKLRERSISYEAELSAASIALIVLRAPGAMAGFSSGRTEKERRARALFVPCVPLDVFLKELHIDPEEILRTLRTRCEFVVRARREAQFSTVLVQYSMMKRGR